MIGKNVDNTQLRGMQGSELFGASVPQLEHAVGNTKR
jgi:hypothetical protein